MSNAYKPEDFSPIYGPDTKPDKVGWYISTWSRLEDLHRGYDAISNLMPTLNMDYWYWNGTAWMTDDTDNAVVASSQNRSWFGLNKDPKEL